MDGDTSEIVLEQRWVVRHVVVPIGHDQRPKHLLSVDQPAPWWSAAIPLPVRPRHVFRRPHRCGEGDHVIKVEVPGVGLQVVEYILVLHEGREGGIEGEVAVRHNFLGQVGVQALVQCAARGRVAVDPHATDLVRGLENLDPETCIAQQSGRHQTTSSSPEDGHALAVVAIAHGWMDGLSAWLLRLGGYVMGYAVCVYAWPSISVHVYGINVSVHVDGLSLS
mmetsp:Transcript_33685/g.97158  ORF Transcript_33685/g.97158 Transcript_33685/m.97158 type:complete len:222 (-) Transcript_33685:67-732(-)